MHIFEYILSILNMCTHVDTHIYIWSTDAVLSGKTCHVNIASTDQGTVQVGWMQVQPRAIPSGHHWWSLMFMACTFGPHFLLEATRL